MSDLRPIIVGTSGHIDHGKTALIRALTGTDTDRLPEEKKRGITIDLGFAELEHEGIQFGFVDVPGHERFVKNMLAGASGIDLVLLVIAADEGVMPQTREHFDICRLLDVKSGIVVLTKRDLVEDEMLELVRDEAAELVQGSFLENAPVIAVSSKTNEGLDDLKTDLGSVAAKDADRNVRVPILPIDRVFTMKGFGTVVTGTLASGSVSEGDELDLLPVGKRVRVRGIQTHGSSVKKAIAGQRTALNIVGVDHVEVFRGMLLAEKNVLRTTQSLDAKVEVLKDSKKSLRSRQRARLHIGSAEVLARLIVLNDSGIIEPGEIGFVQLRLESPAVAVFGDRFVLRSYSPQATIAGGRVLEPLASRHRKKDLQSVSKILESRNDETAEPATLLYQFIDVAAESGISVEEIRAKTGWTKSAFDSAVGNTQNAKQIIEIRGRVIGVKFFDSIKSRLIDGVSAFHCSEPLSRGIGREVLKEKSAQRIDGAIFDAAISELLNAGEITVSGDSIGIPNQESKLTTAEAEAKHRLLEIYCVAGIEPPKLEETMANVTTLNREHARRIFQLLIDGSEVIKVTEEFFFASEALENLKAKMRKFASQTSDRLIDVSKFKDLAGVSRKYAIPLLEYFDREKVTVRSGDKRLIL
ncbi:MAG: selenocysteine-specific translation elongation factor [Pyrinomonadaceae bacterium]